MYYKNVKDSLMTIPGLKLVDWIRLQISQASKHSTEQYLTTTQRI